MIGVLISFPLIILTIIVARNLLSNIFTLRHLPGPPVPSRIVGNTLDLKEARIGTRYNVWAKRYGRTYRLRGPLFAPWLVLGDPKGLNHVLSGRNYERSETDRIALELSFGRGLFCAEGEEHRKMRKMLSVAFTFQSVQEVAHILFDLAHRMKVQWEERLEDDGTAVFDVASPLHVLSLDAISMTMFMHNLSATGGKILGLLDELTNSPGLDYMTILMGAFANIFPFLLKLPSPMNAWSDRLRNELGLVAEEVWAGKGGAGMHAKVLESMSQQVKLSGEPISKDEAVAQVIGILFAGSESSANVISECFYELARHQSIQQKLRHELITFETTHGRQPTYEDVMSATALPYLDAVTRETMRTKAVIMYITRVAAEDDIIPLQVPILGTSITEVKVKAGQIINIPVRDGVNIDEDIWGPDAADYRPERWIEHGGLPDTVTSIRAQGHILTFGDGPKVCLGRIFALAEFKIVVSVIIRHFCLESVDSIIDFYHLGGNRNTVKPMVRGRESQGVQMPLLVRTL